MWVGKVRRILFPTATMHITMRPFNVSHFANLTSPMFSVNNVPS